jgi:hypothetical protein
MPIRITGPSCRRRGCRRPSWKDDLCNPCWRLARMFGHDPSLFAYNPLDGYRDERDTVEIDWHAFEGHLRGLDAA